MAFWSSNEWTWTTYSTGNADDIRIGPPRRTKAQRRAKERKRRELADLERMWSMPAREVSG